MHVITVRNVNQALSDAMWWLHVAGIEEQSRNGPVLVAPGPVCTEYLKPMERVLFSKQRDANPYFHFFEALYLLAGRNDVAFLEQFNSKIGQYSDDNTKFNASYGYRWRYEFGYDQLDSIVRELSADPTSRRCVLAMWNGAERKSSKDIPCNTHAYFDCRGGVLNMTVCNRSNDAVWGCYGANAVHFSMLQEYLAIRLTIPVGVYRQVSSNLHVYDQHRHLVPSVDVVDYYISGVQPSPLMYVHDALWKMDLKKFLEDPCGDTAYVDPFFNEVAAPMAASWFDRKNKRNDGTLAAEAIVATDWRIACLEWIGRRNAQRA